jgi:hypothetical protein
MGLSASIRGEVALRHPRDPAIVAPRVLRGLRERFGEAQVHENAVVFRTRFPRFPFMTVVPRGSVSISGREEGLILDYRLSLARSILLGVGSWLLMSTQLLSPGGRPGAVLWFGALWVFMHVCAYLWVSHEFPRWLAAVASGR